MRRTMMKSKIHRATVTDANLHYIGSVTVDPELMRAADILENVDPIFYGDLRTAAFKALGLT